MTLPCRGDDFHDNLAIVEDSLTSVKAEPPMPQFPLSVIDS